MNYLLAKIKRRNDFFLVLSTEEILYDIPVALGDSVNYAPQTLLEDGEWYKYENFSAAAFCPDILIDDFDSVNYSVIERADILKTSYLCAVQDDYYCFQLISSNMLIRKKWFSLDELSIEVDKPIIVVNSHPDAIYNKPNDTLYFQKLSTLNGIFRGIDQLYREATDAETQAFLQNDFVNLTNNFDAAAVKIPNRKRIALVMDTLNVYTPQQRRDIYGYIQDYCKVPFQNDQFEIGNEEDLKLVLWGIEQRFYTTKLGNEKRIANSIITIK